MKCVDCRPIVESQLELLMEIQDMCIGEIAMGYKLDAEYIGAMISECTGMTAPELNEHIRKLKQGKT